MYIYPDALRAISATVPTAFFVLACQSLQENEPTKRQKLQKTGIKKLQKIVQNRRPEGSRSPQGTIFKGFWCDFRVVFSCLFEAVGQGSVLRKTSFYIVIYNVFGTSTFSKKAKMKKYV